MKSIFYEAEVETQTNIPPQTYGIHLICACSTLHSFCFFRASKLRYSKKIKDVHSHEKDRSELTEKNRMKKFNLITLGISIKKGLNYEEKMKWKRKVL